MHQRLLSYLNIVLVLICAACIYYLATTSYRTPLEIQETRMWMDKQTESDFRAPETDFDRRPRRPTRRETYPDLDRKADIFMVPFYTPTPTPTPTPKPPPPPPPIATLTHFWKVTSLDDGQATFWDERVKEEFTLEVGGKPRMTPDKKGKEHPVLLQEVDLDEFTAVIFLAFGNQTHVIKFE